MARLTRCGSRTWTRCSTTTRNCVWWVERSFKCPIRWALSSRRWTCHKHRWVSLVTISFSYIRSSLDKSITQNLLLNFRHFKVKNLSSYHIGHYFCETLAKESWWQENCQHARSVLRSEISLKEQNPAYKLIRMLVKQSPGLCMDEAVIVTPSMGM